MDKHHAATTLPDLHPLHSFSARRQGTGGGEGGLHNRALVLEGQ